MLIIQDRIYISIKIDDKDIPQAANLIERITMTEGMGALTPAIELILNDYSGVLNKELALTDGNSITITVGRTPNDQNTKTRQYRLFGTKQKTSSTGPGIKAIGIYDAPNFLTVSAREAFDGNSQDVLKEVAGKSKLTFKHGEGAPPEDRQVWMNVCQSRALFVQECARHGRTSDSSCMAAALTSLGELRYFDLGKQIETSKEKIKRAFCHNIVLETKDVITYPVRESRDSSSSGLMNAWQNYGSTRVQHSLSGKQKVFDKLDVTTGAGFLPINQQVAKTVGKTRIDYSALDCGNTHDNYWRAYYQNLRLLALFSEHVSVLTTEATDVELFDPVIYRQANADPATPVNKSDIYIVIGKSILIKNGVSYAERIELVRRSLSVKGESKLAGEDIGSNNASANPAPDSMIDPTVAPAAAARPTMQSISEPTKAAETSMTNMKATLPDHSNAVQRAMPSMRNLNADLQAAADPKKILGGMGQVTQTLAQYKAQAANVNTASANALAPLKSLNQSLKQGAVNTALRQATLTRPGGIVSSMAMMLTAVKQQRSVAGLLKSMNVLVKARQAELKATPEGEKTLETWNRDVQDTAEISQQSSMTTAKMWNTNVSTFSGKEFDENEQLPVTSPLEETLYELHSPTFSGKPESLSMQAQGLTGALASQTEDKRPRWVNEEPLDVPRFNDVGSEFNGLEFEVGSSQRREQDMYGSDWSDA